MQKFTKIIATIGPASCSPEILRELYEAGMDAARINLSHGDRPSQAAYIKSIRQLESNFPILLDTKGPEIRTGGMRRAVQVSSSETRCLVHAPGKEDPEVIPVDYPYLKDIEMGSRILFDDGLVESEVIERRDHELILRMLNEGVIGSGKKVTIQGHRTRLPFLTERDKEDVLFAIENHIQLLAGDSDTDRDGLYCTQCLEAQTQVPYLGKHQRPCRGSITPLGVGGVSHARSKGRFGLESLRHVPSTHSALL